MVKRVVDIDDDDLRRAQAAGGFQTIEQTVAAGLRQLVSDGARRREIARLTAGSLADSSARGDAWR
jgi:Arc/MetJ family transcription regulator